MHADNGKREALDPDPEAGRDRGGDELPAQLLPPAETAEVVDRADRGRDCRPQQEAAHVSVQVEEGERRHEDAEEEREPA